MKGTRHESDDWNRLHRLRSGVDRCGGLLLFAMTVSTDGFDMQAVGMIALVAGVTAALIGLLLFFMGGKRSSTLRENVVQTPGGTERIQERDDFNV
jgi:hypothetical protein